MINILHSFNPTPILFDFVFFKIYWYGLIMAIAMSFAFIVSIKIGRKYGIKENDIYDLSFLLIIFGLIGARIYDIFLESDYYLNNPIETIKIWKGGLAIHGAIISGLIVLIIFSLKKRINFFVLSSMIVPALALGQAIGRFGNYFNQELFGKPTSLPWGIPIDILNRPIGFESFEYFHPTFLYESIILLIIFSILVFYITKRQKNIYSIFPLVFYVLSYSILRFTLEFIKIDKTPVFIGLRWPQIMSLIMILITVLLITFHKNVFPQKKSI